MADVAIRKPAQPDRLQRELYLEDLKRQAKATGTPEAVMHEWAWASKVFADASKTSSNLPKLDLSAPKETVLKHILDDPALSAELDKLPDDKLDSFFKGVEQRMISGYSRADIARALDEMTRINIMRDEKLGRKLDSTPDDEVAAFFQSVRRNISAGGSVPKQWSAALRPVQDYNKSVSPPLIAFGKAPAARTVSRSRVVPIQSYATELFMAPFTREDFDPSKLNDKELLLLSQMTAVAPDIEFVPVKETKLPHGEVIREEGEAVPSRPKPVEGIKHEWREVEHVEDGSFSVLPGKDDFTFPLLKLLSPENYEKAMREAEKRAGISREDMGAKGMVSGALPFNAFGLAKQSKRQEFFQPMLAPNYETMKTVGGMTALIGGGTAIGRVGAKMVEKGWKTRQAVLAGAVAEGALGVAYQHAAPGLLAGALDKPDSSILNFAEAATIAGMFGLAFGGISKVRGKEVGLFREEIEAMAKATSPEEAEMLRQRIIAKLDGEGDSLPRSVKDGEVLAVITGKEGTKKQGWLRRWLTADKGVDPEIAKRLREREAAISAQVNVGMKAEVMELERAIKASGGMDESMAAAITEVIRSGKGGGNLPDGIAQVAQRMYERKSALSKTIGDAVGGELKVVIDGNMDTYLTRSYRIHHDPDWLKHLRDKDGVIKGDHPLVRNAMAWFEAERRTLAEAEILSKHADAGTTPPIGDELEAAINAKVKSHVTDDALIGEVEKLLQHHADEVSKDASGISSILKERTLHPAKDRAIMELLGEYKDPIINYTQSIRKMSTLLETIRFNDDLALAGKGKWVHNKPQAGHGAQIPDSPQFGAMRGKYTTPWIRDIVTNQHHNLKEMGAAGRIWSRVNAIVNWTKVVPSHVAQMRNVQGGFIMNMAAGRMGVGKGGQAIGDFWNSITGMKNAERTKRLEHYAALGLKDDNIDIAFIQDMMQGNPSLMQKIIDDGGVIDPNALTAADRSLLDRFKTTKPYKGAEGAVNKLNDVYQGVDNMMRFYAFEREMMTLKKAFPNMDVTAKMPAQFWPDGLSGTMEQYASRLVRDTYPTYSMVPDAMLAWRRAGVFGNFMSFQAEMFRTSKNIIRQGWREMGSDNPILRAKGAKRVAAFMGVGAIAPVAAERMVNGFSGTSQEYLDAARHFMPPWSTNSRVVITKKNKDQFTMVDTGYTHPHTFFQEPLVAYALTGEMPAEGVVKSFKQMLAPFVDERILLQHAVNVGRGRDERGRPIDKSAEGIALEFAKAFEPGEMATMRRWWESHQPHVRGADPKAENWNQITAVRPLTIRLTGIKGALEYKGKEYMNARRAASTDFSQLVSAKVPISHQEQLDGFRELNAKVYKAQQILHSQIKAAEVMGVDESKIEASFVALSGMDKLSFEHIKAGKFIPVSPSQNMLAREYHDKRPLALTELRNLDKQFREMDLSLEPGNEFPKK